MAWHCDRTEKRDGGIVIRGKQAQRVMAGIACWVFAGAVAVAAPTASAQESVVPGFPLVAAVTLPGNAITVEASPLAEVVYTLDETGLVQVIDSLAATIISSLSISSRIGPFIGLVAPRWFDGVFVTNPANGMQILEIARDPLRIQRTHFVGVSVAMAANPVQPRLYLQDHVNDVIRVWDATTARVVDTIDVPSDLSPLGQMLVSPDGTRLYLSKSTEVIAVSLSTKQIDARYPLKRALAPIAISPDGMSLFVGDKNEGSLVIVLDAKTLQQTGDVSVHRPARGMHTAATALAVTPDGRFLLAPSGREATTVLNDVSIADLRVTGSTSVGRTIWRNVSNGGNDLAVDMSGNRLWAATQQSLTAFALKPAVPSLPNVRIKVGKEQITIVRQREPEELANGDSLMIATATPSGRSCSTAGSSCVIKGLQPGKRYRINVTASNMAGTGPKSSVTVKVPNRG